MQEGTVKGYGMQKWLNKFPCKNRIRQTLFTVAGLKSMKRVMTGVSRSKCVAMWTGVSSLEKRCHQHLKWGRAGKRRVFKQTPIFGLPVVPNISLNVMIFQGKPSPILLWGIKKSSSDLTGEIEISVSQRFEILSHVWSTSLILYTSSGQLRLCFGRLTSN